ncbi:MAG: ABC transporter permease [Thermoproteota archaeon]
MPEPTLDSRWYEKVSVSVLGDDAKHSILEEVRDKLGLTEACWALGIAKSSPHRYLSGERRMPDSIVRRALEFLDRGEFESIASDWGSKAPVNRLIVVPRSLDNETLSRLYDYVEGYLEGLDVGYRVALFETGFERLVGALATLKATVTMMTILSLLLAVLSTPAMTFLHMHAGWSELLLLRTLGFTTSEITFSYVLQALISTLLGLVVASIISIALGGTLIQIVTPSVALVEVARKLGLEVGVRLADATPTLT